MGTVHTESFPPPVGSVHTESFPPPVGLTHSDSSPPLEGLQEKHNVSDLRKALSVLIQGFVKVTLGIECH